MLQGYSISFRVCQSVDLFDNYKYELLIYFGILGSGALSGKMLLERIVENNKIDAYFRSV